jgi:hypothetical protein
VKKRIHILIDTDLSVDDLYNDIGDIERAVREESPEYLQVTVVKIEEEVAS